MMIEALFGELPLERFLDEYYLRLPYASSRHSETIVPLANWTTIGRLCGAPGVDTLLARQGRLVDSAPPANEEEARRLAAQGCTLVIRDAQRHDFHLARLADEFERAFAGAVNVHLYCTPGEYYGFGWHYDVEEVFVLQTAGAKEYSLRKNTVNPWPILETLPHDMRYEREIMPLWKCRLEAGDWLYIPAGYWHMGRAESEAISLAVGVLPPTGIDVFDFLRGRLLDSMRWRQRLPPPGPDAQSAPTGIEAAYGRIFRELADDLSKLLRDDGLPAVFLASRRNGTPAAHFASGHPPPPRHGDDR